MSTKQTIMVPVEVTIYDESDSCIPGFHENVFDVDSDVVESVTSCIPNRASFAVELKDKSVNNGFAMSINVLTGITTAIREVLDGK